MATCPNKNLQEWKDLVASKGEDVAYFLWDKHEGNVPDEQSPQAPERKSAKINSTIFEMMPDISPEKIRNIYDNYRGLMNTKREGKAVSFKTFESVIKKYQVLNIKDTFIFGHYDPTNAVFVSRFNSSPTSKELLAEAIPTLTEQGVDVLSLVPKDVAEKYERSGYTISPQGYDYNFRGEDMIKYAAVSDPSIINKIFNKDIKDVTGQELSEYNADLALEYVPVEIDSALIAQAGTDTFKILQTYLNQFGIVVKDIKNIQNDMGLDSVGVADILSKIAYIKDKKDLPPVAGEFIAYMMQHNPLVSSIIRELSGTDIKTYKDLDKSKYIKEIGKMISEDLQDKMAGKYSKSLMDKIKQLIQGFMNHLKLVPVDKINKNIGIITNNVLQQNKKLITASLFKPGAFGKPTKQVSLKDALDSDAFGQLIVRTLTGEGMILTGSTSLGEQGTIQRPDENLLHDIDWVSPFTRKETIEKFLKHYPGAQFVREIFSEDGYTTDSYVIAPEGHEIVNYKSTNYNGKIIIDAYDVADSTGKVVGTYRYESRDGKFKKEEFVEDVEGKVIDFFSYETYNQKDPLVVDGVKLSNWTNIFQAKLKWARYKDIWDYNRFIPKENIEELANPTSESIPDTQSNSTMMQIENTEGSVASEATISKVKEVLEKMGVSLQSVAEYLKGNSAVGSTGINALADLVQGIVAVAQGKESVALTEEMVHIATAIIEEKNPALITQMISKIGRFKIYQETLKQYKNNPNYQLSNGKPDIRKIKKEAVDKLIAELIINGNEGTDQFPELREEVERSWIRQAWERVLDWFYDQVADTNIDIFAATAEVIMNEDVGDVSDIKSEGVYYQLSDAQTKFQEKYEETQKTIRKVEKEETEEERAKNTAMPAEEEATNWYENIATGAVVGKRVTDRVKAWYRDKFRGGKTFTEQEKRFNEFKRDHGVLYHKFFEEAHARYYNEDGTKKARIGPRPYIQKANDREIYNMLDNHYVELIKSHSQDGNVPLVFSEFVVYDPKEDEAGTLDLVIVDNDGTTHVYDWKFMSVASGAKDVAWYKQGAYNVQLGRYRQILTQFYGVKKIGKIRAIPILFDIRRVNHKNPDSALFVKGIRIGDVDTSKITEVTLIPVSEENESTGIKAIDNLLKDLRNVYEQISSKKVTDDEERDFKRERLNIIKAAARAIQGTLNVDPLIEVIAVMKKEGENIIADYELFFKGQNPKDPKFTKKQLSDFSVDLQDYLAISKVFSNLQDTISPLIYDEVAAKEAKTKKEKEAWAYRKEVADKVTKQASDIRQSNIEITDLAGEFADVFIGKKNLVQGLLENNVELKSLGSFFRGLSDLALPSLNILFKLVTAAKGEASREALEDTKELMEIRDAISKKTSDIRSYVKTIYQKGDDGGFVNRLVHKYDKSFRDSVNNNALEGNRSRKWILENIDVDAYMVEARELLAKKVKGIKRTYSDEKTIKRLASEALLEYDINRPDFTGFDNYLIKRHPLEKWKSKEYQQLEKDPDLLRLYNYVMRINERANDVGYIDHKVKNTFLPYMRKDMAESLAWDFSLSAVSNWGDKLKVRVDDVGYGKINELTNELENSIPKYYTSDFTIQKDGTRDMSEVSEDLFKNLILYTSHVSKYKYMSEMEGQVLLVKKIESFKGHLQTTTFGKVALDPLNDPQNVGGNAENLKLYDQFLRALVYEQKYAITTTDIPLNIGKVVKFGQNLITSVTGKKFKQSDDASATSLIKLIDQGNKYYQLKTLGFEVITGVANLFGTAIQISTQAGNYFRAREFAKEAAALIGNKFSKSQDREDFVELIDMFMPLKDDPNYDRIKEAGMTTLTRVSFSDMLMVFMRLPEYHVEKTIFKVLLTNTMVVDGKFVNINEFVKAKYKTRNSSTAEYKRTKTLMAKEVEQLKNEKSIWATKTNVNGKLTIPGFDMSNADEMQKLTDLTRRISRNATGSMSDSDLNRASMNIWSKSAMVFKGWIPKLVDTRFGEFRKTSDDFSVEMDDEGNITGEKFDIGRIRLLGYVIGTSLQDRSSNIINLLSYNEKGILLIDKMYDDYAKDYKLRTGKVLTMSKDDFTDLIRTNLRNQVKELLIGLLLLAGSMMMVPPEDADKATKNRFRFYEKTIDRFIDELFFFYSPFEWNSMLSRNPVPVLGIATDLKKFTTHMFMETTGLDLSNPDLTKEEVFKKAQPIKYGAKLVPLAKSLLNYRAMIDSEFAKEYDITIMKMPNN